MLVNWVDSSGRCNTSIIPLAKKLVENFNRCFPIQRFTRSCVHSMGDRVQFSGWMLAEIGALRKVLAQQTVGVFVRTSLPRALRIAEVDLEPGIDSQVGVLRHFGSLIPC